MRFDLEINITDTLSNSKGNRFISDLFYNTDIDAITPARFDSSIIPTELAISSASTSNIGNGYDSLQSVPCQNFTSRISYGNDFALYKLSNKRGSIIPFLYAGTGYFFRYPVTLSNNNVRDIMDYDPIFDRYYKIVPENIYTGDILIHTSRLKNNKSDIYKKFEYTELLVPTFQYIDEALNETIPVTGGFNVIYILKDIDVLKGAYAAIYTNKVEKITDFTAYGENWDSYKNSMVNDSCYFDTVNNKIYVKRNNVIVDLIHKISFYKNNNSSYKFLIDNNIVYLNVGQISFNNYHIYNIAPQSRLLIPLPEYPYINMSHSPVLPELHIEYLNSAIRAINHETAEIQIKITCNIRPIISYSRQIWTRDSDVRHFPVDIAPNIINFKSGTLCLNYIESDTALRPAKLTLSISDSELAVLGNIKAKAVLTTAEGIPCQGREVELELSNNANAQIKWTGKSQSIVKQKTNIAGEVSGTLIVNGLKFGRFIQKEWVGLIGSHEAFTPNASEKNSIYLPYRLDVDPSKVYLYFVTGDDPILGEINGNSQEFIGEKPKEYYINTNLDSYTQRGRKVAYVELKTVTEGTNTLVKSSYIKPVSVTTATNSVNMHMFARQLFIYKPILETKIQGTQSWSYITRSIVLDNILTTTPKDYKIVKSSGGSSIWIMLGRIGWDNNWLLTDNYISYFQFIPNEYTKITYANEIPGINDENIIGYFIVTDMQGTVDIVASYYDEDFDTTIYSNEESVTLESFITKEDEFVIMETPDKDSNAYLGIFSYLTVSDYLKSSFGLNACTWLCKYTNGTYGCTRPNKYDTNGNITVNYRETYFLTDNTLLNHCRHTPAYDATAQTPCPGLEARLVNPFTLHVSKP